MAFLSDPSPYRGRFAPTPTGPLHFGSLVAALASYLDAKSHQGVWLLRMEDLDPPREDPEARLLIPRQLEAHGLFWDEAMQIQSLHSERYEHILNTLKTEGYLFPCQCSRKQLQSSQGLHQGLCRSHETHAAWRLGVPDENWRFEDRVYGRFSQNLLHEVGDQVLKRKDGLYAYQLAVVVDDADSGINQVVRGADLLDNTPRQLYLQHCLGFDAPSYLHLPLAVNHQGQKLSKQNQAEALNLSTPSANLFAALAFLNQQPPAELDQENVETLLHWAVQNWDTSRIRPSTDGLIESNR